MRILAHVAHHRLGRLARLTRRAGLTALAPAALFALLALSCKDEPKPSPAPASSSSAGAKSVRPATTLPDLDTLLNIPGASGDGGLAPSGAASAQAAKAEESAAENAAEAPPPVGAAEVVKLVEPGAEPREVARYAFVIDKADTTLATVRVSAQGGPMGAAGPQPPIRLTLKLTPKAKSGGKTAFAMQVTKAEILTGGAPVPPEAVGELKAAEAALATLTATFNASARGALSELRLGAGKGAPQEAQELIIPMLEMLFAPLPEEPIGLGARWVASTTAPVPGEGSMISTFTMTARTPTTADITIDTSRSAKPQAIQDPRAPRGATMQMDGKGKTKLTVRFGGVAAKAEGESTTNVTFKDPSSTPPRTAKSTVTVRHTLDSK
jgi:hypothetical protein